MDIHDNHDGCNWYFGVPFKSKRKEAEMDAPQRKFKVGDRVRVVKGGYEEGGSFHRKPIGSIDVIVNLCGDGQVEGEWYFYMPHEIELLPHYARGTRIQLLRDHGVYKSGHRGTVTYENDENVGALMDIGRYAAFPHEVVGLAEAPGDFADSLAEYVRTGLSGPNDTAPDCAGCKEERGDAEVTRQLLEVSWPELRIEPQPKFKAGDRVVTSGADGEPGIGVVLHANCDGTYQVRFAAPYNECREAGEELSLIADEYVPPSPCIVALINKDGKPRPSQWPHVHPDSASATAEAERLARNNPGTEFAVYQRVAGRVASVEMKEVA